MVQNLVQDAYDFGAFSTYLSNLEAELDKSAKKCLADHGYADLADASEKLSAVPKIISIDFNPSASKNILKATFQDILVAFEATKAGCGDGSQRQVINTGSNIKEKVREKKKKKARKGTSANTRT